MSKPVKHMMRKELAARFAGVTSLAVVDFTGLDAYQTYSMRGRLNDKDIQITVVKNSIARQAFQEAGLESASDLLDGPCAVAWGSDSVVTVVRELLDIGKEAPNLEVKGALLEGEIYAGADDVKRLSTFPTRSEAIADVLACVLSGGANLAAAITGPGGAIAGALKSIEEKGESEAA